VVIFEGVLIWCFFNQTVRMGSNFAKIEKAKLKTVHSNKGIKHSEDFDKQKFKGEYLGRIFMNSHVWILFFNSHLTIINW
jgi:hypothetical protein